VPCPTRSSRSLPREVVESAISALDVRRDDETIYSLLKVLVHYGQGRVTLDLLDCCLTAWSAKPAVLASFHSALTELITAGIVTGILLLAAVVVRPSNDSPCSLHNALHTYTVGRL
jgi:hypothetical protein